MRHLTRRSIFKMQSIYKGRVFCLLFYYACSLSFEAAGVSVVKSSEIEKKEENPYHHRVFVAEGVQRALQECREKSKWDRWNCPKKAFEDILTWHSSSSNKENALTHAYFASGIVLSLARTCSVGTDNDCGCSHTTALRGYSNEVARPNISDKEVYAPLRPASKFTYSGCDESVKFAFKVSRLYLESWDISQNAANRRINAHNFEVGRKAVKKNMKKACRCHGMSGSCQFQTCWDKVPDMNKVGEYLMHRYRLAAKVGAMSAEETNLEHLNRELRTISSDKLVFIEAPHDYCYPNPSLGINGTLGRYCSRTKGPVSGNGVSWSERHSCYELCTKCGYKIERQVITVEKQCDCRFVYCCWVECRKCRHEQVTYRCAKHAS